MKQPKNITYTLIGIISSFIIIVILYFSALYDKNISPENSNTQNYYETKDNLIAKINIQKNIIDKQNEKLQSLESRNSTLNQKNVKITDALYTKDFEIESYKKKLDKLKKLEIFECKKANTSKNHIKDVLNCLDPLKVMLVENYQTSGKFPTYLSDLSLELLPSENELIQEINFGLDGTMNIYLNALFGKNKKIALTPEITQSGMIQFTCKTNLNSGASIESNCTIE